MPKQKTHKGTAKRFSITKTGKVKRAKALRNHNTGLKPAKHKRNLRKAEYVSKTEAATIRKLIPYK